MKQHTYTDTQPHSQQQIDSSEQQQNEVKKNYERNNIKYPPKNNRQSGYSYDSVNTYSMRSMLSRHHSVIHLYSFIFCCVYCIVWVPQKISP